MAKIKLIRSIIPLSPTSAQINLTMKKGESYLLMDSVVVIDVKTIKTDAMIHEISGEDIYVDMMAPRWKDAVNLWYERFCKDIDSYGNDEHKFMKLYLANKMIKD